MKALRQESLNIEGIGKYIAAYCHYNYNHIHDYDYDYDYNCDYDFIEL